MERVNVFSSSFSSEKMAETEARLETALKLTKKYDQLNLEKLERRWLEMYVNVLKNEYLGILSPNLMQNVKAVSFRESCKSYKIITIFF